MVGNHAQLAQSQNWADEIRDNPTPPPRLSKRAIVVGLICALGPLLLLAAITLVV